MATATAAAVACPVAALGSAASSTSTPARAQLATPFLKSTLAKPLEWSSKTVSNGSRVNAFNVVNPNNNLHYETLSYLPPLTQEQITKQVDYLLRNKLIPAIEFDKSATLTREGCKMPGYYEGRYWVMWRLPLFGANDSSQVLNEIKDCVKEYPEAFVRVIGFDNVKQVQIVSFLVAKPPGY